MPQLNFINSLNKKIALLFIALGLFLLTILFVQIIPKMQKEQKEYSKQQLENIIYLTTQQLKLATKALKERAVDGVEYRKSILESKVENIKNKLNTLPLEKKEKYLNTISKDLKCDIHLIDNSYKNILSSDNKMFNFDKLDIDEWTIIRDYKEKTICPRSPTKVLFSKRDDENNILVLSCKPSSFRNKAMDFEFKLKKDIQNSFLLADDMHKGKTFLMWINVEYAQNSDNPLYEIDDDYYYNNKYCISKVSNLKFPRTGLLTGKQIIEAIDQNPIRHLLDKDDDRGNFTYPALTWVRSINNDPNRRLLYITTVLEEDFHNNIDSSFWKILPASLIALLLAIIVGFYIFKRLFKSINILADTAHQVRLGNINIRSGIKGKDDIGLLGTTFDNMLDSIEKNIYELDKKVENRTEELKASLDEKETLLKEIHHRVKNNLAMTIELIKVQKAKIMDQNTKTALGDIQERIHTMELLHRRLYESKNLNSIDIKKYIIELAQDIHNSLQCNDKIKIDIDIQEHYLMDIEYALPCGLIINEALTNSLKHAFDKKNGEIKISLNKQDQYFYLILEDNGKGISENIDIQKSKSLGLRLITSIVKGQLLGTIDHLNKNGTKFIIKFKYS